MLRTAGSCRKLENHPGSREAILLWHSERSEESQFILKTKVPE
jgi:hypothetical protein